MGWRTFCKFWMQAKNFSTTPYQPRHTIIFTHLKTFSGRGQSPISNHPQPFCRISPGLRWPGENFCWRNLGLRVRAADEFLARAQNVQNIFQKNISWACCQNEVSRVFRVRSSSHFWIIFMSTSRLWTNNMNQFRPACELTKMYVASKQHIDRNRRY